MTINVIDVTEAPYFASPTETPANNRDAIAAAIAAAKPCSRLLIPCELKVAPGADAYIKLTKGLDIRGVGWCSRIIPDPATVSNLPVIWALGVPSTENFFHSTFHNFQIGHPFGLTREGGDAIRVEANQGQAGTENWEISQVYIREGKQRVPGGSFPFGIRLVHSNAGNEGAVYNFTVEKSQIMGGIKTERAADSIRVLNCLIYGENGLDIDIKPSEGQFTMFGNNVSSRSGLRLRSGLAPVIQNNIFTQQLIGSEAYNALIDLDGQTDQIIGATLMGNRIHKEASVDGQEITTRLLRVNNVTDLQLIGGSIRNPNSDIPVEFTSSAQGDLTISPLSWSLGANQPKITGAHASLVRWL